MIDGAVSNLAMSQVESIWNGQFVINSQRFRALVNLTSSHRAKYPAWARRGNLLGKSTSCGLGRAVSVMAVDFGQVDKRQLCRFGRLWLNRRKARSD